MEYTESLLKELVESRASESETLEFKAVLPKTGSPAEKAEFAKDIVALANGAGGVILYGIACKDDCANAILPISAESADRAARRLEQTLHAAVEPRELDVRFRPVDVAGGYVLEVTVPRSYAGPHRVVADYQSHFYVRSNALTRQLTVRELRDAFLGRDRAAAEFRAWREHRLTTILQEHGAKPLERDVPIAVLHAAPLECFERDVLLSLQPASDDFYRLLINALGPVSYNFNLDGVVAFTADSGRARQYGQIFRTGQLELAFTAGVRHERTAAFAASTVAVTVRDAVIEYTKLFDALGFASGPIVFALSVLRVGVFTLGTTMFGTGIADRDNLAIPEVVVTDAAALAGDVDSVARPILDMLWQSFGIEKCNMYDGASGTFTGRS